VLSVIAVGHLPADAIARLLDHFEKIEVLQIRSQRDQLFGMYMPERDDAEPHYSSTLS